jgi:hypothetical protein
MSTERGKMVTVALWIAFAALLLYVKDRREKAYWQDVTDKIITQMEPPKGEGAEPRDGAWSDVGAASEGEGEPAVVKLPPPKGMGAARASAASASADQAGLKRFARSLGVLP